MSVEEQLRIVTHERADRLVVELLGELDMVTSPLLADTLTGLGSERTVTVVLDLRGVSFLDSTGLKAIFRARNMVRERGQEFAVTPGSAQVQRLLSLTRLGEHLRTIETPDAVLV
jgi:anti-sigma B factor antagonist